MTVDPHITTIEPPRQWLARILHCRPDDLKQSSSILAHPAWDSFAQVEIMLHLEARYGVEMSEASVSRYTSLAALIELHDQVTGATT